MVAQEHKSFYEGATYQAALATMAATVTASAAVAHVHSVNFMVVPTVERTRTLTGRVGVLRDRVKRGSKLSNFQNMPNSSVAAAVLNCRLIFY